MPARSIIRNVLFSTAALAAIGLAIMRSRPSSADEKTAPPAAAPASVAVVELFTSEGCSSCPSADKLLAELASDRVLPLEFHVDYWNQLGWKDPFSSADYTKRQYEYAKTAGATQVYTPQMVVGGADSFVGSNRGMAKAAIEKTLKEPAEHRIRLASSEAKDGAINVSYAVQGDKLAGTLLNLAVVQSRATSDVTSGENKGSTLPHMNVVRVLKTSELDASGKGQAAIKLPTGVAANDLKLVGFTQRPESRKVTGGVSIELK